MMENFLNDFNALQFALDIIVICVAYWIGHMTGEAEGIRTMSNKAIDQMKAYISSSAIIESYAPYWDDKDGAHSWRCPRTGEFVDHDDVTQVLEDYRKLKL